MLLPVLLRIAQAVSGFVAFSIALAGWPIGRPAER